MEKENFFIRKAVTMMDSGKTIKCMASEPSTILMEPLPTREIGKTINLMVRVKFITINRGKSMVTLTILTSTS